MFFKVSQTFTCSSKNFAKEKKSLILFDQRKAAVDEDNNFERIQKNI
jgi:hypothetical protein